MRFDVGYINAPKDEFTTNEDTVLIREDFGLFGVFDGIGGSGDGDVASRVVSDAVEQFYTRDSSRADTTFHQAGHTAREALMEAQEALQQRLSEDGTLSSDMGTTATIGHLYRGEDDLCLAYAHVGDTGLFLFRRYDNHIKFVTEEEADGNVLHNALNARGNVLRGVRQYGVLAVDPGDRLVFFSDGISGDSDEQRLSREEYQQAISGVPPQDAARALADMSRKADDTSVVVVDVMQGEE